MAETRNFVWKNNGVTLLAAGINSSQTSVTVTDGSALPSIGTGEIATLVLRDANEGKFEIMYVTARSGNTLTVERGKESTTPAAFPANTRVSNSVTAAWLRRRANPGPVLDVRLLLHFDGTDGTTDFVDSSTYDTTINVNSGSGGVTHSTGEIKFGAASCIFGGGNAHLTITDGLTDGGQFDIRDGDFTVEGFYFRTPDDGSTRIVMDWRGNDPGDPRFFTLSTYSGSGTGTHTVEIGIRGASGGFSVRNDVPTNEWVHWALVRSGDNINYYINGVKDNGSLTITGTWPTTMPDAIRIGAFYLSGLQNNSFIGYQDEIRVVKGTAMYTANFTPPTAPFPNPGEEE